jgi:hypothetical protein
MKNFILTIALVCVACFTFANVNIHDSLPGVLVPRGVVFSCKMLNDLDTRNLHEGQLITMRVDQNVVVGDKKFVVITENTPVLFRVKSYEKRGVYGKAARITLQPVSVQMVDGRTMPLYDQETVEFTGQSKRALAWGLSAVVPAVGLILLNPYLLPVAAAGLLVKGTHVAVPGDYLFTVKTDERIRIY